MKKYILLTLLLLALPSNGKTASHKMNILFIGDSHTCQSFGVMMHAKLSMLSDVKVTTFGSCGSAPRHWYTGWTTPCGFIEAHVDGYAKKAKEAATPNFPALLTNMDSRSAEPLKPDVVIVALGANLINVLENETQIANAKQEISRMVNDIVKNPDGSPSGRTCIWIGPPDGKFENKPPVKQDRLYKVLEDAIANKCQFLNSRAEAIPQLVYPEDDADCSKDGVHWDMCTEGKIKAVIWVDEIFKKVKDIID